MPLPCPSSRPPVPRAVLLDRDGTIIEDRHYLADPEGVVPLPGAASALARLSEAGCRLFLVSNQSGVGRGYFSEADVRACQRRLDELLAQAGVRFTDTIWCPHTPEARCRCRKPAPGLWEQLAARHGLVAGECLMIGDKLADVAFAVNAGLSAGVLVLTGKGAEERRKAGWPLPDAGAMIALGADKGCRRYVAEDLPAVVRALAG